MVGRLIVAQETLVQSLRNYLTTGKPNWKAIYKPEMENQDEI
jgi:hypothetical protein